MNNINDILINLYELEGLLREIDCRGEETPVELSDATLSKSSQVAAQIFRYLRDLNPQETEPQSAHEPVIAPETKPEPEPELEPMPEPEPEHESEPEPEPEPEPETKPEPKPELEPEPEPEPEPTRPDIMTLFTINDKFRFKRELFGSSDLDMTDAIRTIGRMTGYEEAEEYFFGYLCWPRENETAKEFMEIVKRYYTI